MPVRRLLTLYSRAECALCDAMAAALAGEQSRFGFELEVIDVDADPALAARFNDAVPVVHAGGIELMRYRFDPERLRAYFSRM
jgi:glutaredoxin